MSSAVARRVIYFGRVQGVGFRATVLSVAQNHQVAGYVRNLSDGTVELVVTGSVAAVEGLLMAVADRLSRYIVDTQVEEITGEMSLKGFEIR